MDAAGTIFLVWPDCRFRTSCDGNDLVLSRSTAPGTWTPPQRIPLDGPAANVDYVIPGLAVDRTSQRAGARLALAYYRLSASDCSGAGCELTAALASSADGGRTWRAERVGAPMSLNWLAPTRAGRMVGDYVAAVLVGGRALGILTIASPPRGGVLDEAIAAASMPLSELPRNLRLPAIAGAARVGQAVVCRRGTWTGSAPIRYAYRWLRNGHAVAGASAARYRLRAGDAGAVLACRVTAANKGGSAQAASRAVRIGRGS